MTRVSILSVIGLAVVLLQLGRVDQALADDGCSISTTPGFYNIRVDGICTPVPDDHSGHGSTGPPTRTIPCGGTTGPCASDGAGQFSACVFTGSDGIPRISPPFIVQTKINGIWVSGPVTCPGDASPADTQAAIRAEAIRLLPHVGIGHAYSDGALVNAEEIFWVDTPTDRPLPAL